VKKEEYLLQLRKKLVKLPPDDVNDAMEYYEEYLEEVGPENEETTMMAWGSPSRIASQIMAQYAVKQMSIDPSAKKGLSTVWIVLLAVFASPIAVPLAAALVAVVLALVVTIIALIASLGCVAVSFAGSGIVTIIAGFCLLTKSIQTAVFYIGVGLFLTGAGIAIMPCVVWLSKKGFNFIAIFCSKYLLRRISK
jgi:uncharacterized membrane protein